MNIEISFRLENLEDVFSSKPAVRSSDSFSTVLSNFEQEIYNVQNLIKW